MKKKLDLEFLQAVAGISGLDVVQARLEKGDIKPKQKGKEPPKFQNRIKVKSR
jgi:hypothetical protein